MFELCYAIANQDYEAVLRLVQKEGVDINARGYGNFTPLYWAFPLGGWNRSTGGPAPASKDATPKAVSGFDRSSGRF